MTEFKQGIKVVLTYIGMMVAVTVLQVGLYSIELIKSGNDTVSDAYLVRLSSISNLILYISLFLILTYMLRKYLKSQFIKTRNDFKNVVITVLLGIAFIFFVALASSYIMDLIGVTETSANQAGLNELLNGSMFDKIALVIFTVLLAPIVEELVFRKAIYSLFEKASPILAIIISGLSFGLLHVLSGDYIQIIFYGALGLVLALVYFYSKKNILAAISVHFIYNLVITIIIFTT